MHVQELVLRYGLLFYPLIVGLTFLEGETVVILSGAAARCGLVGFGPLVVCAWTGSFLGDQMWFTLSRRHGPALLRRFPAAAAKVGFATSVLERHAVLFILSYRFVYGFRNVASLAIGASSIPWGRFALLNFASSGLWAMAFSCGGYLAGAAVGRFLAATGWLGAATLPCLLIGGWFAYRRGRHATSQIRPPG